MINRTQLLTLALAFTAIPALAAPVTASKYEQAELAKEIQSCVAEVGNHADYSNAAKVKHEIVVTERRSIGHKLNIKTSVYSDAGDEAIRAYATRCVVYRDNKPVRFKISELHDNA